MLLNALVLGHAPLLRGEPFLHAVDVQIWDFTPDPVEFVHFEDVVPVDVELELGQLV